MLLTPGSPGISAALLLLLGAASTWTGGQRGELGLLGTAGRPAPAEGVSSEDWAGWRGPRGLGLSPSLGLPVELGAGSRDLRWQTEPPGDGISSPIVVGDRVLLTSAFPGTEQSRAQNLKGLGLPLLALLVLFAGWRVVLRRASRGSDSSARGARLPRLDGWLTALATLAFLAAAGLAAYAPRTFPSWGDGVLGWAWFYTGGIGAVGIAAALGWSAPRSPLRLVGALILAGLAVFLWQNIGLNSYGQSFRARYRAVMVAPCVAGALWHVLAFALSARAEAVRRGGWSALGASSVVAAAALLFVTVNLLVPKAGMMRAVLCYDLETGAELWRTPLFVAPQEQKYDTNSFATPTPCSDGERVFAYFGSGWACLDLDGRILWQGRDDTYAPNTRYGCGASPVIFEDTFVVLQEKEYVRPSFIAAFDKRTGSERFRVNPHYAGDSYTTPILMPREGTVELVTASAERAVAHDPRDGALLWSISLPIRQMVPSLCYQDDVLFVSGGTHSKTSTSAVRLSGKGKDTQTEILWQTDKSVPTVASPVLVDGLFFTITDGGIMTCLDPVTGERLWRERLETGEYWSSLVAGDGKIYAINDDGMTFTVAASREFEVLGRGELGEACLATPAIAHGNVLVRTFEHLYCFASPERAAR